MRATIGWFTCRDLQNQRTRCTVYGEVRHNSWLAALAYAKRTGHYICRETEDTVVVYLGYV